MTEVLRIIRVDFDGTENEIGNAMLSKCVATFAGDKDGMTPHGRASKWLSEQEPVKLYAGWDGKVYPEFSFEKEYAS